MNMEKKQHNQPIYPHITFQNQTNKKKKRKVFSLSFPKEKKKKNTHTHELLYPSNLEQENKNIFSKL